MENFLPFVNHLLHRRMGPNLSTHQLLLTHHSQQIQSINFYPVRILGENSRKSSYFHSDPSEILPGASTFLNNLDDEINLLTDDISFNPSSSSHSAFENLASWHNDYFQQRHFYPNHSPSTNNLPMLSSTTTNIDNDNSRNSFASNALTFL